MAHEPPIRDFPPACAAFEALVNGVLDGDRPAADLAADPHPAACPACRVVRDGAAVLLAGIGRPAVPPAGFAERTARAAVADFRRRKLLRTARRVSVGALAAGMLVAVWLASPRSPLADRGAFARWWPAREAPVPPPPAPNPSPKEFARQEPPKETIRGQLSEAGSAVVSLTRKATDDTLAPARNLFASPAPRLAPAPPPAELPDALTEMPDAARAGLEPIAGTARRAVNLFLRDVGGVAGVGKSKS